MKEDVRSFFEKWKWRQRECRPSKAYLVFSNMPQLALLEGWNGFPSNTEAYIVLSFRGVRQVRSAYFNLPSCSKAIRLNAAATAVFLIYPIGQGSFSDGMPLGISGKYSSSSRKNREGTVLSKGNSSQNSLKGAEESFPFAAIIKLGSIEGGNPGKGSKIVSVAVSARREMTYRPQLEFQSGSLISFPQLMENSLLPGAAAMWLIPDVVIQKSGKMPEFSKYDGTGTHENHLFNDVLIDWKASSREKSGV
ncbi:Photosystem II protein D1 [Sesamum alatum]|uniref:Photosystem II protein D1 n=1 Tax=Sesamum alatum TaxID=300844 RepID=A0AAE1XHL8_9LAMI|nr:Photosystem II protein D1 [Sesamum alatum]